MKDRFKLKAWDKENKRLLDVTSTNFGNFDFVYVTHEGIEYDLEIDEQCELLQCTGKKDKNDKLIYEGHILKDRVGIEWKIVWDEEIMSFIIVRYDEKMFGCRRYVNDLKIIGHIYTNPEMLEQS